MSLENDTNLSVEQMASVECQILCALCTSPHLVAEIGRLLAELSTHDWRDPEHRVVYEALLRIRVRDAATLRSELAATATRMGFPDVGWGEYFEPGGTLQVGEVESRIRSLIGASAQSRRQP